LRRSEGEIKGLLLANWHRVEGREKKLKAES
jgi:hypothetical protein